MDGILENLRDPSWWFTGLFFIVVGLIIAGFSRRWVVPGLGGLATRVPYFARLFVRGCRLRRLRRIKSARLDGVLAIREIVKSYVFLMLFLLSAWVFFATFLGVLLNVEQPVGTLAEGRHEFGVTMMIVSTPTYVFEWLYFRQSAFVKQLLERRKKMHNNMTQTRTL
jgi:type III secretory pathway component EscS